MNLRNFEISDSEQVNSVALAAFDELKTHYDDWPILSAGLSKMSELSNIGEIIVAEKCGQVIGAVVYVPPGQKKARYFDPNWPIIRMLVVDPAHRGIGAGRALTNECIERALRDKSPVIALHTSPVMAVALPMYLRMGFKFIADTPLIYGVPYSVYLKSFPG